MKHVIVTGAGGFIGLKLINELIEQNIMITALVRPGSLAKQTALLSLPITIEECNLDNMTEWCKKTKKQRADTFYHLAWEGVSGDVKENDVIQLKNVNRTVECLKAAHKIGCQKFIGIGSIMELEVMQSAFYQGSGLDVRYIYGSGKLAAHCISKSIATDLNMEHIWATITNVYGEGEVSPRLISTTLRNILKNEPLAFTSGMQNCDFVHVSDVARGLHLIGERGIPFCNYIIGGMNARPLKEFLTEIPKCLDLDIPLTFGTLPFVGASLSLEQFSCEKTTQDTGYQPKILFAEGIRRTMNWVRQNEEG